MAIGIKNSAVPIPAKTSLRKCACWAIHEKQTKILKTFTSALTIPVN
jgi:hypothetical protein